MHLVHEDDGAASGAARVLGGGHDVLDFANAAEHRAEGHELGMGAARDQARQRRLAAARRTPQDHRAELIVLDGHAQRLAGTEQSLLADEFVERARAHALGERRAGRRMSRGFEWCEEAHDFLVGCCGPAALARGFIQ